MIAPLVALLRSTARQTAQSRLISPKIRSCLSEIQTWQDAKSASDAFCLMQAISSTEFIVATVCLSDLLASWSRESYSDKPVYAYEPYRAGPQTISTPFGNYVKIDSSPNILTTTFNPKLAVMVWIHGGAFAVGSGNSFLYGPDHLVGAGVVLVTLNYEFVNVGV